jgi:hypothetical protein
VRDDTGAFDTLSAAAIVSGETWPQVDEHSQAIHLVHHRLAESREAVVRRRVGGRIGPCRFARGVSVMYRAPSAYICRSVANEL